MFKILIEILLILFCFDKYSFANTGCDDWEAYKDDKCFKLFYTLQSFDEAINSCIQHNATLVTIETAEEQLILENFLFSTNKIVENVWTGLKYVDSKYKWNNDLISNYTNWSVGSPKNATNLCVQFDSDDPLTGKWTDVSCLKRNLALCEKVKTISLQQLMNLLITNRNQLDNTILLQNNTKFQLENMIKDLNSTNAKLEVTTSLLLTTRNQLENTVLQQNSTKSLLENTIKEINTKLEVSTDLLKITSIKLDKTERHIDNFFSNKWINFKTFTENNMRKALIYPFMTQSRVLRSEAINICTQHNATLVDIMSVEKQRIVEAFLYQIDTKLVHNYWEFWIGVYSDSGKYKWMNSGNELTYTNWASGQPIMNNPYVVISHYNDAYNNKWFTYAVTWTSNVFCEILLNF